MDDKKLKIENLKREFHGQGITDFQIERIKNLENNQNNNFDESKCCIRFKSFCCNNSIDTGKLLVISFSICKLIEFSKIL